MREPQILQAMRAIRMRLENSPNAADTAEGIHAWWIGWHEPLPPLVVTQEALARLKQEAVVEDVVIEGGRQVWRKRRG